MRKFLTLISALSAFCFLAFNEIRRDEVSAQTSQFPVQIQVTKSAAPINFKSAQEEPDKKIEPSAAEAIGDGTLLLVADDKDDQNKNSLAIVETATGKVLKRLQLPNVEKNPKWEGMAKSGEDFYIIGSHAVNAGDAAEKLKNRSRLFRFRLKNVQNPSQIEIDARPETFAELDITDSLRNLKLYDTNPHLNRVKIEGLAVRGEGNKQQLIIGLREPSEMASVYSAELGKSKKLELKPYFSFAAGDIDASDKTKFVRFKLSSIEYHATWSGFFLVTSTEDEINRFYGNILWYISDEAIKNSTSLTDKMPIAAPQMIKVFASNMKAEGLCLLPKKTSGANNADFISAVLLYDNDTEDTFAQLGLLGMMQTIELSNLIK